MKKRLLSLAVLSIGIGWVAPAEVSAGVVEQSSLSDEDPASCDLKEGDAVDVVMLIDQSLSLAPRVAGGRSDETLNDIKKGISEVARALEDRSGELNLSLGVISFSTLSTVRRPLTPFRGVDEISLLREDLGDVDLLGEWTDYVGALEKVVEMFESNPSSDCRLLIWFTDGVAEPATYTREEGIGDPDYVKRVVASLFSEVCGSDANSLASRLRSLDVLSYVLMVNENVESWLASNGESESRKEQSAATRFRASLDVLRAVSGDPAMELNDVATPLIDPSCDVYVSGESAPRLRGQLFSGTDNLFEHIKVALCLGFGCRTDTCPEAIDAERGEWISDLYPPASRFQSIDVVALSGSVSSTLAQTSDGSIQIPHSDDGRLNLDAIVAAGESWRLRVEFGHPDDEPVEKFVFCVLYELNDIQTTQMVLQPVDETIGEGPVSIGETVLTYEIDWSALQDDDNLDPSRWLAEVLVESPIGEVSVADDFQTLSIQIDSIPDIEAPIDSPQYLRDQFKMTLKPESEMDDLHVLGASVTPAVRLIINENQPVLQCDDDEVTALEGDSNGKKIVSTRECTISAPKSGVATLEVVDFPSEDDAAGVSWVAVDDRGAPLGSQLEIRPGDDDLVVRFESQKLSRDSDWEANFEGKLALVWSENSSRQEAVFALNANLRAVPNPWWAWVVVAIIMVLSALLSLFLLWGIGNLLARLPDSTKYYQRSSRGPVRFEASVDTQRVKFEPRVRDELLDQKNKAQSGNARSANSEMVFRPYTLNRKLKFWPPFGVPYIEVKAPNAVRALPSGPIVGSARLPFRAILIIELDRLNRTESGANGEVKFKFIYRSGSKDFAERLDDLLVGLEAEVLAFVESNSEVTKSERASGKSVGLKERLFDRSSSPEVEDQPDSNPPTSLGEPTTSNTSASGGVSTYVQREFKEVVNSNEQKPRRRWMSDRSRKKPNGDSSTSGYVTDRERRKS